jgi:hypothetical protein
MVLPSGQKLTLDLLATVCEGVQHRWRFCLHYLNCVKMAGFQFYLQSRKQREVGWVGDDNHVVFGQKVP